MSEHENENEEPIETPGVEPGADEPGGEALETDEPADEPGGDGEQGGEPGGDGEQAQAAVAPPTEKEIERANKRLETLAATNARRVGEILGDDAVFLVPCPACSGFAPGFVWPREVAPPSEEAVAGMRALMGETAREQLQPHPLAVPCETCNCLGSVVTPSHVQGYDVVPCPDCAGTGRGLLPDTRGAQSNGTAPELQPVLTGPTAPPIAGEEWKNDPDVQRMEALGFVVFPKPNMGA